VPLTLFQERKLARMFEVMDVNGDGLIDRSDFTARVAAVARLSCWGDHSPEYIHNLDASLKEWRALCETVDTDQDGSITIAEFLSWGNIFLDDRAAVRAWARGDVQLLFDAVDTDGDERITIEEYRTYLTVCGVDGSAADAFFAHADLNEDGRVTRSEMSHAVEEFFVSENPKAGGNFLFGPLDT
jgi:Ca2+-binding EF-hand superfamily protein